MILAKDALGVLVRKEIPQKVQGFFHASQIFLDQH